MFNKYMAVGIKVKDFEKAFKFYTQKLGFTVKTVDHKNKFAEVKFGELVIALLTDETLDGMCGKSNFSDSENGKTVFAVEVDNVKKTYKKLTGLDVNFIEKPKTTPWGQKVAYFKDPEGYIWELSEKFEE